jgi:hypothetical protein
MGERRDDGATQPFRNAQNLDEAGEGGETGEGGDGGRPRWTQRAGIDHLGLAWLAAPGPRLQRFGVPRLGLYRGEDLGGKAFAAVTILPTVLLVTWLVVGLPLLLAGRFLPVPMVLIATPVAVVLITMVSGVLPGRWPGLGSGKRAGGEAGAPVAAGGSVAGGSVAGGSVAGGSVAGGSVAGGSVAGEAPAGEAPAGDAAADESVAGVSAAGGPRATGTAARAAWWGLAGTVVVAAGFALWQIRLNSPQFIVSRDAGAYLQFGYWISEHGSLPIPALFGAFGGSHPGLTLSSLGFVGHAGAVAPRLAPGLPMLLAAGLWAHGLAGGAVMSPLLGGCAVLTVGGLTGRLAGPQWAPVGAFLLALTLPEAYVSRSAFTEIFAQVLLFGGLCMVVDSLARPSGLLAGLGGFALGITVLVQVGSLWYVLPTIMFLGALLAARKPQAFPLYGGLVAGAACGLVGCFVLAGPLMDALTPQLGVTGLAAAGFVVVTLAGATVGLAEPVRQRAVRLLARPPLQWLPEAGALLVVAVAIGLLIRPYVQTVRGGASLYVAALQRLTGLPVDPGRLYAEDTLYWVIWYLGAPALLLGVAGLALLTRRCLRALITWRDPTGMARVWALPLMIIGWGALTMLWRPGTAPDQPWASRRLVPVLLPGLIVAAVWVAAWLAARARERGASPAAVAAAVACFVAALVVPSAMTTFGIAMKQAVPGGLARATTGLAFQRTSAGELTAVRALCGAIPGSSSVVFLDSAAAAEFSQVIRGMCGVPAAAAAAGATPGQVEAVTGGITRAGRRPVLLASNPSELTAYGTQPRKVLDLTTAQDAHLLTQPPASTWPVHYVLWMSAPGGAVGLPDGA